VGTTYRVSQSTFHPPHSRWGIAKGHVRSLIVQHTFLVRQWFDVICFASFKYEYVFVGFCLLNLKFSVFCFVDQCLTFFCWQLYLFVLLQLTASDFHFDIFKLSQTRFLWRILPMVNLIFLFFFNLVLVWEDYNCNFDEFPGRLSGSHIFLTWNETQLLNGTIGVLRSLNSNCFPYHGNWMQRQILSSNTMFDWPLVFRCKTNLSPYPLHAQWCISPWCKTNNIHYIGLFLWQSTCKRPPIGSFRTNTFTYSNTALITLLPTKGHHVRHCDARR
jgi:hypothetical protein